VQDRLLRDLGGARGIAEAAPAGAQQRGVVALDERPEGVAVPRPGGGDELVVGGWGHPVIVPCAARRVTRPLPSWIAG
jgi:hypothetical protein